MTKKRSPAWLFWALLTVGALLAALSGTPWLALLALATGAYAVYLFRGGRIVVWFF